MSILDELNDKSKSKRYKGAMLSVVPLREHITKCMWSVLSFVGDVIEVIWEAFSGLIKFALFVLFVWWVGWLLMTGIDSLDATSEQRDLITRYFEMYPDELRDSIADALKDDNLTIGEFIRIENQYEDLIKIDDEKLVARERGQWLKNLNDGLEESK